MTQSPKKYVSTFTSSTTNRGVEAKEIEIGNIQLDTSSQYQESDVEIRSQASGDTGSYLQVVVQKHKKKDPIVAATQTSPRLPIASSPIKAPRNGSGDTQLYLLQQPMLVAYPNNQKNLEKEPRKKLLTVKEENRTFWSKFKAATKENSPDKVDIYYFERSNGEFLATSDGSYTYTENFAQQISRIPNRLVAEVFSVPQIIASVPVAILLNVERSILVIFRSFIVGSIQIWSDYFLKPVLTLAYNAILQPPLVFAGNVGRGLRDALRPIGQILGDVLEPVVKVLSAIRLVNVEKNGTHNV